MSDSIPLSIQQVLSKTFSLYIIGRNSNDFVAVLDYNCDSNNTQSYKKDGGRR